MIEGAANRRQRRSRPKRSVRQGEQRSETLALPFSRSLTSVALVVSLLLVFLLPLSPEGSNALEDVLMSSAIIALLAIGLGEICGTFFGATYRALFFVALATRLLVLVVFYILSPSTFTSPEIGITTPSIMVWPDDVHYVGAAEELIHSDAGPFGEVPSNLRVHEKVIRIARVIAVYKSILGEEQVWVRLMNTLIGALTVVFAVRGVHGFLPRKAETWMIAMICFGPQFIESSILLYKEGYTVFAGALTLMACSSLLRQKEAFVRGIVILLVAAALMYWCRKELFLLVLAAGVGCLAFRRLGRGSWFGAMAAVGLTLGLGLWLAGDDLEISERIESQLDESGNEFFQSAKAFGWAAKLSGPARVVHIPIAFVNPPTFNLKAYVFPQLGNSEWFRTVFVESRTLQWWLMLPWLLLGIGAMSRNQNSVIWPMTFVFMLVFVMTALIYNGNHPEAVRYRSSFLPMAVMISGYGFAQKRTKHCRLLVNGTYAFGLVIAIAMGIRN